MKLATTIIAIGVLAQIGIAVAATICANALDVRGLGVVTTLICVAVGGVTGILLRRFAKTAVDAAICLSVIQILMAFVLYLMAGKFIFGWHMGGMLDAT